jgi:hypothetical protein
MYELSSNQSVTFSFVSTEEKEFSENCGRCCFTVGEKFEKVCPEMACTRNTRKDNKDGYYICAVTDYL